MAVANVNLDEFTDQASVRHALEKVRKMDLEAKPVSDIRDSSGCQYVDLVMEGGGVLGIALAGYTYCLEQAGIRFLSIAGTSAGAINALLLAAAGRPNELRAEKIVQLLADLDLSRFQDGNPISRALVAAAQSNLHWLIKLPVSVILGLAELPFLLATLGLNPGDAFEEWLGESVAEFGAGTEAGLNDRLSPPADLELRRPAGQDFGEGDDRAFSARLALFASDVTTRSKVELPAMADLYWSDHARLNPARYARASMSVPFFFRPLTAEAVPRLADDGTENSRRKRMTGYRGADPPKRVRFLDGGILSNFPIYAFHDYNFVPRAPTFGARLGLDRHQETPTGNVIKLAIAAFRSTQHILDYDFIVRHPEYDLLTARIKTGNHHWLNFSLDLAAKKDLFASGVIAAQQFLEGFDWEGYKMTRTGMRSLGRHAIGTG